MIDFAANNTYVAPVAIGGVGGSGTRVIATFLEHLGFYIGADLNPPMDNLWFTYLFNNTTSWHGTDKFFEELVSIFQSVMRQGAFNSSQKITIEKLKHIDRNGFSAAWSQQRFDSLHASHIYEQDSRWGWKEPNTHLFIDRLAPYFSGIKYIHVIRHGVPF